jgi:hypothetical protein
MKKFIILFLAIWFIGCGSGEINSEISSSEDNIEVRTRKSLIDAKHQEFYLEFLMKNNYSNGVEVELFDVSVDLNACVMSKSSLDILDHTIKFSKPYESRTISLRAEFVKPCIPNGYIISAKNSLNYEGTTNSTKYQSKYKKIEIDGNITHEDITSIFDYGVQLIAQDKQPKTELNSKKRYKLFFVNLDSNSSVREDRVHSITIKSSDPSKVKFIDPNNYVNDNGETHSELTFKEKNGIDLYIQTYNKSGVVNFDVSVKYTNNRGEVYDLNTSTSLTISSGEPMAFSINSVGVKYNQETKWFEQKFLISASDKYNNIVNIKSKIIVSAMADYTKDGSGNRVLYGNFSNTKAKIVADKEAHSASLKVSSNLFTKLDIDRDFLLLFGQVSAGEALGKWDIDKYNTGKSTLTLTDSYYGDTHSSLGFAVGHNYYSEICSSESKEWELEIDSTDGIYQLDDRGKTYVTLKFPAYMIGKKIAIAVNFSGKYRRSGEVHFETLHSFEGVKSPKTISIDKNSTMPPFSVPFEIDTGSADRFWVKNAKVVCNYTLDNVSLTKIGENKEVKSVNDCRNSEDGEVAYWTILVKLRDVNKSGSVTFDECQVSSFINKF